MSGQRNLANSDLYRQPLSDSPSNSFRIHRDAVLKQATVYNIRHVGERWISGLILQDKYLHLKRFPRVSLQCKLVSVQY